MANKKRSDYHHGNLRAALLDAAVALIATEGLEGLTLRALSQRIGVSRTAPYRHFADKSVLLAAVAEAGFNRLHQQLQAVSQQADLSSLVRIQEMGVAYILFAIGNPTHYRLMFGHEKAGTDAYPALEAAGKTVFESLVMAIQQGQAENRFRAGEPRQLAYVAWATVHGLASLLLNEQIRTPDEVEELARFTTHSLLEGLSS